MSDCKRTKKAIHSWLDRQAAITKRECDTASWKANYRHVMKQRDELQEKVGELEATLSEERKTDFNALVSQDDRIAALEAENAEIKSRHCPHYHVKEHYCDVHETRIAELLAKVDALEADRRNWTDGYYLAKLTELEAENATLREKLSQALDHAHSISKLGELD